MYELQVDAMSCNHCISKVTKSVRDVDANAKVEIHLGSKTVRVNSNADLDEISFAITEAGYFVSSSKTI